MTASRTGKRDSKIQDGEDVDVLRSELRCWLLIFYFRMEADLERILVESIQLETENITLKKLIRSYNSMPDMQDQLKNMVHYNQQVCNKI